MMNTFQLSFCIVFFFSSFGSLPWACDDDNKCIRMGETDLYVVDTVLTPRALLMHLWNINFITD